MKRKKKRGKKKESNSSSCFEIKVFYTQWTCQKGVATTLKYTTIINNNNEGRR